MLSSRSAPARGCSSPIRTRPGNDRRTRTPRDYANTSRKAPSSRGGEEDLEAVALALNNRPRKVLGWKTPAEVFSEQLPLLQQPGAATTS